MRAAGTEPADIAILGAGPVGCALALALRGTPHRIALCDAGAPPAGFRPVALSHASRLILERLGVWGALAPTPIETVRVSQQGAFGRTQLDAAEAGVPALGYVVAYSTLALALRALVRAEEWRRPAQGARLTVHAEGVSDDAHEKRYEQHAVAGRVRLAKPARSTAYERFTPEGPIALLPTAEGHALIWTVPAARAAELVAMRPENFLRELSETLGPRIGRAGDVQARSAQALVLRVRRRRAGPRRVHVGNAAQTLHPVAGQGLNLGLRDAWDLAHFLRNAADPGADEVLTQYAARRRADAFATILVTDLLAGTSPLARAHRSATLAALELFPPARRFFARRMIFGPSALP